MKTMKKRISQLLGLVAVGTALMAGVSCSNDTEELMGQPGATEETEHTAVMHLTGGLQSYTPKRRLQRNGTRGMSSTCVSIRPMRKRWCAARRFTMPRRRCGTSVTTVTCLLAAL